MNRLHNRNCCDDLFAKFKFKDLQKAKPPNKKGVYVIKVKTKGKSPKKIIKRLRPHIKKLIGN